MPFGYCVLDDTSAKLITEHMPKRQLKDGAVPPTQPSRSSSYETNAEGEEREAHKPISASVKSKSVCWS